MLRSKLITVSIFRQRTVYHLKFLNVYYEVSSSVIKSDIFSISLKKLKILFYIPHLTPWTKIPKSIFSLKTAFGNIVEATTLAFDT